MRKKGSWTLEKNATHSIFVNLIGWNFSEDLVVFAMKQKSQANYNFFQSSQRLCNWVVLRIWFLNWWASKKRTFLGRKNKLPRRERIFPFETLTICALLRQLATFISIYKTMRVIHISALQIVSWTRTFRENRVCNKFVMSF